MFLKTIANDLYEKTAGDLRNITLVFPTKRAGLFVNQYLATIAGKPVWAPAYATLNDMFHQMSDFDVADQPLLIFHLFAAYQQAAIELNGAATTETIDSFYSWGEVMLSDFDDIDNNLSDPKMIFTNLKDLDELTTTDYLSEEQIRAIERYFGYFKQTEDTKLREKFLSVWNLLLPTYTIFRNRLRKNNIAYEGMLKREVIEQGIPTDRFRQQNFVFVGFNVLNTTEKKLMERLKEEGRACFYWDYDLTYVKGNEASFFEAGRFIRDNIRHFGSELPEDHPVFDSMRKDKQITFVESPSNTAQTRYAGNLLKEMLARQKHPFNQYAVVLANEKLLQPMLHAMPVADKDNPYKINVTMGFPLYETPVASFVMAMLELQVYGKRGSGMWNYKQVANLLRHPFTVRIAGDSANQKLKNIKEKHLFFITEDFFSEDEFLNTLFQMRSSVAELLTYLSEMVQRVGVSFFADPSEKNPDFDRQLYEESVYNAHVLLNRLKMIYDHILNDPDFMKVEGLDMSQERMVKLIRQILQSSSVPFHGEPAEGIQIIGMLETRTLDFPNLIILGMEDENIPKAIRKSSFIPYTLREAYGMTTFDRQSSLQAYGFYRLIQRAEHITLIYSNAENEMSKGEMSRYMTQMLVEQDLIFNESTRIHYNSLESKVLSYPQQVFEVKKTDEMIQKLKDKLSRQPDGKRRFLSPSALNSYINCPFKFYLEKIAGMKVDDELDEEVGNDVFGTIFHYCMENIYKPLIGRVLKSSDLHALANNKEIIEQYVDNGFRQEFFKAGKESMLRYNGEQWLNREVIIKYVAKQLKYDALLCPMTVNAVENQDHIKEVDIEGFTVSLGGIIDRIDTIFVGTPQEQRRILDYKTSSKANTAQTLDDLFNMNLSTRPYHILQTFYYADIYTDYCKQPVGTSLMYIKPAVVDMNEAKKTAMISMGPSKQKKLVTDFASQYKEEFHQRLEGVIREIFSKDVAFSQTNNEHTCEYCDFRVLCNRRKPDRNY